MTENKEPVATKHGRIKMKPIKAWAIKNSHGSIASIIVGKGIGIYAITKTKRQVQPLAYPKDQIIKVEIRELEEP